MLLKKLKRRLSEVEEGLARIEGELKELKGSLARDSREGSQEISCAGLIDEWVNGREED